MADKLKKRRNKVAKDISRARKKKPKIPETNIDPYMLIPTGSTLLNLACSDNPTGGFQLGTMNNLIGDSSSGKTFLGLTAFAEMAQRKRFDKYRFVFDDAEAAAHFNLMKLFGRKLTKRIEPPKVDKGGDPIPSDSVEDFYGNIVKAVRKGDPFVYILDSFDSIGSAEDKERANAYADGKDPGGSYKTGKARMASEMLRHICRDIERTESCVIIISQTRDNITATFGSKKTRSGGRALKFYSTHEMWLAIVDREVRKNREVGVYSRCRIKKNKLTGKKRTVDIPIFYDYGIDDILANIKFLLAEDVWKKVKQTIHAKELKIQATMPKLIERIEQKGLEQELIKLVSNQWHKIEDSIKLDRKSKYQ